MNRDAPSLRVMPAASDADREWIAQIWQTEWGGETMVSRGRHFHIIDVPGLIGW